MTQRMICLLLAVLAAGLLGNGPAASEHVVTPASIAETAARLRQYLYRMNRGDEACWETRPRETSEHFGHTTALVALALLEQGESFQNPRLQPTLRFLQSLRGGDTYTIYPRMLCWARLPASYQADLERDLRHLLSIQKDGLFFHDNHASSEYADLRATLYGLMALHAAAEVLPDNSVPRRLWEQAVDCFAQAQRRDGGWSYSNRPNEASSPLATVAGLTALHLCAYHLTGGSGSMERIEDGAQRGERFLQRNFELRPFMESSGKSHSYEAAFHDLYLLERLTRYSGVRTFAEQDWFPLAVQRILEQEAGKGSIRGDVVESAFALLVLTQSQANVWVSRLNLQSGAMAGQAAAETYAVTRRLSALREADLHWQVVSVNDPLLLWLNAPVLWLSVDGAVELNDEQIGRLRRYLDLGGVLLANPQGTDPQIQRSLVALGNQLYPHGLWQSVAGAHPLCSLLMPTGQLELQALSNGVRDVMLVPQRDLRAPVELRRWQEEPELTALFWNLYAWSSERGRLAWRMHCPLTTNPATDAATPLRQITVGLATLNGLPFPEPLAWPVFGQWMAATEGVELRPQTQSLSQVRPEDCKFLQLVGVDQSATVSDAELDQLERYVRVGGTVLIETIGGQGDFTTRLRTLLEERLQMRAEVVATRPDWPQRVVYRPYSVCHFNVDHAPRLQVITLDNRPAIYFSEEDLTLGLLGVRHWGIHGYRDEDARLLMKQMVLQATQAASTVSNRHAVGPQASAGLQ